MAVEPRARRLPRRDDAVLKRALLDMGCKVLGSASGPPEGNWRAALAARMGSRPRRLGGWGELALWGARSCLDEAGEDALPASCSLYIVTAYGPVNSLQQGLAQIDADGMLMPFTFMQAQPVMTLAALGASLQWTGDGGVIDLDDPLEVMRVATAGARPEPGAEPEPPRARRGALVGWVEEHPQPVSVWFRVGPRD